MGKRFTRVPVILQPSSTKCFHVGAPLLWFDRGWRHGHRAARSSTEKNWFSFGVDSKSRQQAHLVSSIHFECITFHSKPMGLHSSVFHFPARPDPKKKQLAEIRQGLLGVEEDMYKCWCTESMRRLNQGVEAVQNNNRLRGGSTAPIILMYCQRLQFWEKGGMHYVDPIALVAAGDMLEHACTAACPF